MAVIPGSNTSDTLDGTAFADTITGLAGNDVLRGLEGDDALSGGGDNDTLIGGSGNDTLQGGDDTDTASYASDPAGVIVLLDVGLGLDGYGGRDLLVSIENVIGTIHGDLLIGNEGANRLDGLGQGVDTIRAGGGNDTIVSAAGAYLIDGGGGTDMLIIGAVGGPVSIDLANGTMIGPSPLNPTFLFSIEGVTASTDAVSILGNAADNDLRGGTGNDALVGGGGADTLTGGGGNDTLAPGAGADFVSGGSGIDVLDLTSAPAGAFVDLLHLFFLDGFDGQVNTIELVEVVNGTGFGDELRGGLAAETLNGGGGDDTLIGSGSGDLLDGGPGFDLVGFENGAFGAYADMGANRYLDGAGGLFQATGVEGVRGTNRGDVLIGDLNGNLLIATAIGDTTIPGGDIGDVVRGMEGNDTVVGSEFAALLDGGQGTDMLRLQGLELRIDLAAGTVRGPGNASGSALVSGFEIVEATSGNDTILGGAGAETLRGEWTGSAAPANGFSAHDSIRGGGGNDSIFGGYGQDRLFGDDGQDTIDGGAGDDTIDGGATGDSLLGGEGSDSVSGGAGADVLRGGDGNDTLYGGTGADTLFGGLGFDRFVLRKAEESRLAGGVDRFSDFNPGEDRIDISKIDADPLLAGNQAFQFMGTGSFTMGKGQVRYELLPGLTGVLVTGHLGDGVIAFQFEVGVLSLTASDIIL